MKELAIKKIRVRDRFRKDLGDIDSLAASIDEVGLLHPIVVRPKASFWTTEAMLIVKRLSFGQKLSSIMLPSSELIDQLDQRLSFIVFMCLVVYSVYGSSTVFIQLEMPNLCIIKNNILPTIAMGWRRWR